MVNGLSGERMLIGLAIGIAVLIFLVLKTKIQAFLALIISTVVDGVIGGMPLTNITIEVDGVEKTFTTKEFDLLTFLAENPNHVFTKEELFREIWDMDSIGDIATVTVHIKKIREKIETDTSKPQYIETIWGVGYRFKL